MKKTLSIPLLVIAMLFVGCAEPVPRPPHSLMEYEMIRRSRTESYPVRTIITGNLQRVLDEELPTPDRVGSLRLVLHLGSGDPEVRDRLSKVLSQPNSPYELHRAVLSFLLEKDYPGLAGYVVPALSRLGQDPTVRDSLIQWLTRHPSPEVLTEIVKLWAEEPSTTGLNEPRFRYIVERITGRSWDEALLDGIGSEGSFARGRALEILVHRIPRDSLKQRILSVKPKTQAVTALQSFVETFDYLPATRAEFAAVVTVFKTRLEMMSDAARLAREWGIDYGYRFNVRDFHLLSRLGRDPLRNILRRAQLILELSRSIATRRHVRYSTRSSGRGRVLTDAFGMQAEVLSVSDMWNLYLLNEMLARPRMQLALKIIANRVRSSPDNARNGLVFYQHGQPEAILYPAGESGDEEVYSNSASSQLVRDSRDALCRFHANFKKTSNVAMVGPSAEELRNAKEGNYYGLTLTSVSKYEFCAHYYNPKGLVVSLGKFPFRR